MEIARTAGEQWQASLQAFEQRRNGNNPHARRGKLDGQRQAIDAPADFGHYRRVGFGERKLRIDQAGALGKELIGFARPELFERISRPGEG